MIRNYKKRIVAAVHAAVGGTHFWIDHTTVEERRAQQQAVALNRKTRRIQEKVYAEDSKS